MKKTKIIYWIFTIIFAGFMLFSSIPDIMRVPSAIELITTHLGYPSYFIVFLGVAKFLGSIALIIPGFPRIKEWAYAGLTFDLIAATVSFIAVGDPASKWIFMLVFLILPAGSYIFYHKKLKEATTSK
jgi:uncharacterized membrane protein YphA (DoxX/SURF4 family)